MQVDCSKCIESINGGLSHLDCKRSQVLIPEERALVLAYCGDHVVARCCAPIGEAEPGAV